MVIRLFSTLGQGLDEAVEDAFDLIDLGVQTFIVFAGKVSQVAREEDVVL